MNPEPVLGPEPEAGDGESTARVGFNVLNTIIGSGIVCLPYALHNAGFGFGLAMLGVTAVLSQFSLFALVATGQRTGTAHFSSVTRAALGTAGYHVLNWSMLVDMVGTVVLYLMLLGDLGTALAAVYLPFAVTRAAVVLCVSLVGVLPLLFFRNTGPLARLSAVSVLCLPCILLAVALRAPRYADGPGVRLPVFGPRILPAMGVLAFTFSSCHAAFPNYTGLRDRSTAAWVRASSGATAGAAAISAAFAIVGYLSFGSEARPNILDNFPESDGAINLARLLFAVSLMLTAPMGFYPIRDTATEMLKIDPTRHGVGRAWESACTVVLFAVCAGAAARFTDLGLAYELIGALSSSVVNFVLPALAYLWAGTDVSLAAVRSQWRQVPAATGNGGSREREPLLPAAADTRPPVRQQKLRARDLGLWALAWAVAAFGVWVMVLGTHAILHGA
ncbi:hypothetical protein H4R18_001750 [Coemansia javaensis]|uniref:Amino acid transporter transmembrane domain-containing protein n=1 Tax=Coemansia javaensis TaxID=2761396 RepID=A0A9W8HE37_9FUNG|nr:hypothetical protein H4R18_001750 [Coemansia javaensis]